MARQDRPFRELSIWVRPVTSRSPGDAAEVRDFSSRVYFGPTAQGAAAARTDDENYMAYDPGDTQRIWPANDPTSNLHRKERDKIKGFDITLRLVNNLLKSEQPTTVTGVEVTAVDPATTPGTGTLTFVAVGTLLSWQAPGAGAPGAAQNVGAGGPFTLAGGDGTTIDVLVTAVNLPAGDEADVLTISADDLVADVEFAAMAIDQG